MKQELYHHTKEVYEASDIQKVASLLANPNEEWIATDAMVDGNGNITIIMLRIK